MRPLWRYLWALPNTLLGLFVAALAVLGEGRAASVDGILEVHGGVATALLRRWVPLSGGCSALTLGHVVLGASPACLERTRAHERVHVRQYERWGPCFLPAYLAAGCWALLRGRDPYRGNAFERAAFAEDRSACRVSRSA